MQKLKTFNEYDGRNKRSSLARRKICMKTKAEHKFVLHVPKIFARLEQFKNMSPLEFDQWYNAEDRYSFRLNHTYHHLICTECGKEGFKLKHTI